MGDPVQTTRREPAPTVSAGRQRDRRAIRQWADQWFEPLEAISLLSTLTCPTISGFVFLDVNSINTALTNNGLFDVGESPIPNAQVELLDANNQIVATTTTDATGAYNFGGLDPGETAATPVSITQTITLGNPANPDLPTNYTGQPFAPALQLFDPSLGTLQSVQISSDVLYNSHITVQNLSLGSPATGIQASINGNYVISGLGPTLTLTGTPSKSGTGADLPPASGQPGPPPTDMIALSVNDLQNPVLTSPQDLAFFTAKSGQTSITPTMTALGSGVASAGNGNGTVTQLTFAAASLTVKYTYIPEGKCLIEPGVYKLIQTPEVRNVIDGKESQQGNVLPPDGPPQTLMVTVNNESTNSPDNDFAKLLPTPGLTPTPTLAPTGTGGEMTTAPATITNVTRFGVHQQPTKLAVMFHGAVNAAQAANPDNYFIVLRGPDGRYRTADDVRLPIVTAVYDSTANAVLLTSARRLNLHYHHALTVRLSAISASGNGSDTVVVFGGKEDLGGFVGNHGVGTALIPLPANHEGLGTSAVPFASLGRLVEPAVRIAASDPDVHLARVNAGRGHEAALNNHARNHHAHVQ